MSDDEAMTRSTKCDCIAAYTDMQGHIGGCPADLPETRFSYWKKLAETQARQLTERDAIVTRLHAALVIAEDRMRGTVIACVREDCEHLLCDELRADLATVRAAIASVP